MQLFNLECPMRLDQYQLTLSKEILFKFQFCVFVEKEILFESSLKLQTLLIIS